MQDKGLITAANTLLGGVARILITPLELLLRLLWLPVLVVGDLFESQHRVIWGRDARPV